jgi:glutathione S-transferase
MIAVHHSPVRPFSQRPEIRLRPPLFARFAFLDPDDGFERVRRRRQDCIAHPAAQQVSAFVFELHWRSRPWPPRNQYRPRAGDADLGLLPAAA